MADAAHEILHLAFGMGDPELASRLGLGENLSQAEASTKVANWVSNCIK